MARLDKGTAIKMKAKRGGCANIAIGLGSKKRQNLLGCK